MKTQLIFIALATTIAIPTNLFSALQDFNLNENFPKKTVTLTINTKPTKTTWKKIQENKLRTAAGGFTTMVSIIGTAEVVRIALDNNTSNEDKTRTALGIAIFAGLSYYLLNPIFSEDNTNSTPEQNNNQH